MHVHRKLFENSRSMSAVGWSKRADYPHINTPSQIWQSCQQGLHLEATVICIASVLLPRRPRIYLLAAVHLLSTWTRASSATHALLAGIYSRQHSQSHQLHIPSKTALHLPNPSPPHKPDPPMIPCTMTHLHQQQPRLTMTKCSLPAPRCLFQGRRR